MIIKNASTKGGQNIVDIASYKQGETLSDVYGNYSTAKASAYNWCKEQYNETENHHNFRITGHSFTQFTVAWNGTENGEPILRYETRDNSYMVYLNR